MTLLAFNFIPLDIVLCRIDQSGPEGVLRGLMDGVHAQLPENILPMRVDSMETGEAFVGYLPRGHTQGEEAVNNLYQQYTMLKNAIREMGGYEADEEID